MEDTARTADRDSGEGSQLRIISSLGRRQGQELARKARVLRQLGQDVLTALFVSGPLKMSATTYILDASSGLSQDIAKFPSGLQKTALPLPAQPLWHLFQRPSPPIRIISLMLITG